MSPPKIIAIIGGGPSGLMAAEILAQAGHQVTIYDRMPSVARKFLLAGRGGLNLTHSEPPEVFVTRYREAASWMSPHLQRFGAQELRAWCEGLGQETFIGSSGRIFPRAMKAAPLLRAWLRRLEHLGVRFAPRHLWRGWTERGALVFEDATGTPVLAEPDATLLALGGASWPRLGSDGSWTSLLAARGVSMVPLKPANMGFVVGWSEYFRTRFAGQPLSSVRVTYGEHTHQGEAMITADGLEGGVMYALSAELRAGIEVDGQALIHLDLRPQMSTDALTKKLSVARGSKSLSTYLRGAGFSALSVALLREAFPASFVSEATASQLAMHLKHLPIRLNAAAGIERAISSAGGIATSAVTDELMLRALPGVFVAGEMLDWEAPTGGYLLQGCFSTAVSAASGILHYLQD